MNLNRYIEDANRYIEEVTFFNRKENLRDNITNMFNLDKNNLYVSCDELISEDDITTIIELLNLSPNISLIIREKNSFEKIKDKGKDRVFLYEVSKLEYAFSSDIHIYLNDKDLLNILFKKGRVFNSAHPNDYPKQNLTDIRDWGSEERLEFFFKEDSKNIQNGYDLFYCYFKG